MSFSGLADSDRFNFTDGDLFVRNPRTATAFFLISLLVITLTGMALHKEQAGTATGDNYNQAFLGITITTMVCTSIFLLYLLILVLNWFRRKL